jgi:hypothetical protein
LSHLASQLPVNPLQPPFSCIIATRAINCGCYFWLVVQYIPQSEALLDAINNNKTLLMTNVLTSI